MRSRAFPAPKVPAVLLLFWVVKLLTTAIGETGSDFLGTVSIPLAAVVGVGGFAAREDDRRRRHAGRGRVAPRGTTGRPGP